MAEGESFGEAEYTLRFPAAETAEHVRRELSEKGYEVEVASSAAGAWDVQVRWKGWRPAQVARAEPGWMRGVAAHNGGSLAE